MQVVLIAPFLMRFRLGSRTFGGEVGLRLYTAVQDALPDFVFDTGQPESPMLFDHHVSTGGSRLSGKKTVGTVHVEDVGDIWLRFDPSGYCHLMQTVEVADRDAMHRRERQLAYALNSRVERWVDRISTAMLSSELVDPVGEDAMQPGMLVWWHRVLIDPPEDQEPAATRVYGVERKVHDQAWLRFGDGFTTLAGVPSHRVGEVLTGVMAATDDWIALDEANRLISGRMRRLEDAETKDISQLDQEFITSLKLGKDLALRDMVRLEDSRYTVNASGVLMDAAAERWNMERERAMLDTQLQSLRDSLEVHRTISQSRRDERRNRLLFVFTSIALFQSVLVWYDFAHEDKNTLGPVMRLVIVSAIAVLTIGIVASALIARRRD